jgi:hypothetical protein
VQQGHKQEQTSATSQHHLLNYIEARHSGSCFSFKKNFCVLLFGRCFESHYKYEYIRYLCMTYTITIVLRRAVTGNVRLILPNQHTLVRKKSLYPKSCEALVLPTNFLRPSTIYHTPDATGLLLEELCTSSSLLS